MVSIEIISSAETILRQKRGYPRPTDPNAIRMRNSCHRLRAGTPGAVPAYRKRRERAAAGTEDRHEPEIAVSRPVRLWQRAARNIFRMDDGNRLCHRGDDQFCDRSDAESRAEYRGAKHAVPAPSGSADRVFDRRCLGLTNFNRHAARLVLFTLLFGTLGSACTGPK